MSRRQATRTDAKLLLKRAALLAATTALAGVAACGSEGDRSPADELVATPSSGDEPGADTGSVSFSLTAQPGVELDTFNYIITGPGFSKTAHIDVSHSSTLSALVAGIPAGTGYSLTLMGKAVAPAEGNCSGSTPFSIAAGAVTTVPITVSCHLRAPAPPSNVPVPPLAIVALGCVLLGLGAAAAKRRDRPLDA